MSTSDLSQVEVLRNRITTEQRSLLTEIWKYYRENRKGMPIRLLHMGKESARLELEQLGGSIVKKEHDPDDSRRSLYQLTLLGIFLTEDGEECEQLLEQFIEYVANVDPLCTEVHSQTIADALNINSDQIILLGDLIVMIQFPFSSGSNRAGKDDWTIYINDEVENIPADRHKYVHEQTTRYYSPDIPLDLMGRQHHLAQRLADQSNTNAPESGLTSEDVVRQCNQLLKQADRFVRDFKQLLQTKASLEERQHFADIYQAWYTAGQVVILDETRELFDLAYIGVAKRWTGTRDILAALTADPEEKRFIMMVVEFEWNLKDQVQALLITRRYIFPRTPRISDDIRYALARICNRWSADTIDRLFLDNGCLPSWWAPPLKPLEQSKGMARVMGWFDGIVFHTPAQEIPIARAVYGEILRKRRLTEEVQQELGRILVQLAQQSSVPQPDTDIVQPQIDAEAVHAATLLATHRRRLQILETQAAMRGLNTSPELLMEIEDLQQTIHKLEHQI